MSGKRGGVVLLHGLGRSGGSMYWLGRTLAKQGFAIHVPTYSGRRRTLEGVIADLEPGIMAFAKSVSGPVHFVAHSLGGLVVRALLNRQKPDNLGRVVMLAPPNGGGEWAEILVRTRLDRTVLGHMGEHLVKGRSAKAEAVLGQPDYAVGIIAGNRAIDPIFSRLLMPRPNDGKVTVSATRLGDTSDHIILPVTHTFMVFDRKVHTQVHTFLELGRFDPVSRTKAPA
jgi:pimeloyl-ACP methyl ester carboxylesterase